MVLGIGVDTADISIVQRYFQTAGENSPFFLHTFTEYERQTAENNPSPMVYLATRYAVKEATFKAIAHLTPEKNFDLRMVETRNAEDGHPFIYSSAAFSQILQRAGVDQLHVSITTVANFATVFVIAENRNENRISENE